MAYALLFSGQANQHADMLPWLESAPASAPALRCMEGLIGRDWRATLADPQRRGDNGFAQVLITGTALAAWAALQAARDAGATSAGYVLLRLPLTVKPVFLDWLSRALPQQQERIEARLRQTRGGQLYESDYNQPMS